MPPSLDVVIVEDDLVAQAGMVRLVERDPEFRCVAATGTVTGAVDAITRRRPHILLLDVQLRHGTGFDVIRTVTAEAAPVTIFVTAYDDFAVRAFEVCALDYIVKPFSDARLIHALARAKRACRLVREGQTGRRLLKLLEMVQDQATEPRPVASDAESTRRPLDSEGRRNAVGAVATTLDRLAIRLGNRIEFVVVDEIDWIEADDYYARIHSGAKTHLLRETMAALESRLDRSKFFRSHRSAIVNLRRVSEIRRSLAGSNTLLMNDGTHVPLTRARTREAAMLLRRSR